MSFSDLYSRGSGSLQFSERSPKRVTLANISVRGSKNTAVYLAHSYPTKVPPEAIMPLIEHFTRKGDVVCDPFAGSGMTGVAARRLNRHAHLNDLSPLAFHIAWNVTRTCDPTLLREAAMDIVRSVQADFDNWYSAVCTGCMGQARLNWLLWGDTVRCPGCNHPVRLWDGTFDPQKGTMPRHIRCHACGAEFTRLEATFVESAPVWASVACLNGCGRRERPALHSDALKAAEHELEPIRDWAPSTEVVRNREMYIRSALHLRGIETVRDFYTARNLRTLARLWAKIMACGDERIRQALAFAFTNTAWHGTRMRRYNARGGQRPLTGTLYIPQMSVEVNVLEVYLHKIDQLGRFYAMESDTTSEIAIQLGSATNLSLPAGSVDYVFTDPPFGSNIFYGDCNLIAESWLQQLTDVSAEAVVNRSLRPAAGGKTVADYATLMVAAFSELRRVMKPGAWATIVFQNTDPTVWKALKDSLSAADLILERAGTLDKSQQSHKGYRGRAGIEDVATSDMVLHLRRRTTSSRVSRRLSDASRDRLADATDVIHRHLSQLPPIGASREADRSRTLPFLYSLLLQAHFNGDIGLEAEGFTLVRQMCMTTFECDRKGRWFVPENANTSNVPG
jgi:16S rRNA G966 N2-methylase RsmD